MMMRQVSSINWGYVGDAVPAFVTLALMPLTYSVAYGLIAYVDLKAYSTIAQGKILTLYFSQRFIHLHCPQRTHLSHKNYFWRPFHPSRFRTG